MDPFFDRRDVYLLAGSDITCFDSAATSPVPECVSLAIIESGRETTEPKFEILAKV